MDKKDKKDIIGKILSFGGDFFHTKNDPSQIQMTRGTLAKISSFSNKSFIYSTTPDGKLIAWITVVPTSIRLARQFLEGVLTERELLDLSEPRKGPRPTYSALYLCSAYTVAEYRRNGHVLKMLTEAVESIRFSADSMLLAWPHSIEGRALIKKLEKKFRKKIKLKQS